MGSASQSSQMEIEDGDDPHNLDSTRRSTSTPQASQESENYQNQVDLNCRASNTNGWEGSFPPDMQSNQTTQSAQREGVPQAQPVQQNTMNILNTKSVVTPQMNRYSNTTSPWQQSPSLDTFISMTPQHNIIAESSSMMSAKMTAVDLNMSECDNVSNLLGSDISELGAKLLYDDFDMASVDGEMNGLPGVCSPINNHQTVESQRTKALDQPTFNQSSGNGQSNNQDSTTNFTLSNFGRTAGNGTGRFF
ncbi:hypothetical protein QAD02_016372 [Eretmocerus hayati]|uniref:Uncharacterized protein n=1 Tax=Eretmocerus hayati TaxID=131215 RepID=A0ACC2PB11_9HYME|nr:hypothetical protein QAD02_016372 [Eretmocerus hayati]